ncbi:MAG: hypothetical protein KAR17_21100 [Cyclobacteriaceae bacterium]|nr:hypothetical protein [Cyclobacteriaceae bacterium]
MKLLRLTSILLLAIFLGTFFQSCMRATNEKKIIVYINSYHRGHPSSDEIMDGLLENFPADSFNTISYFMDTKRNPAQDFIESRSAQLYDSILAAEPDILIVSDDNAVKYLVKPNLQDLAMPVVFCGVNWSDREYDLPANKVTGMLEILPLADLLLTMRPYYPSMQKLLVLSENTTTSKKEKQLLDTLFNRVGVSASNELVDNFDQWKSKFKDANQLYDIIYIPTHGAIKGWDHNEAIRFINQNIKVPLVTCEDFMMPYVVFGMTKVAREQGIWAAMTSKKILKGSTPADFPVTRNQMSTTWLNSRLAEKIGFQPDKVLLSKARIVNE